MKAKKFTTVIAKSRALNGEEKQDLLSLSDNLPKEYKEKTAALLDTFDAHSWGREKYLREKFEESYAKLEGELVKDGVEDGKRTALLAKARMQIEKLFIHTDQG